MMELHLGLALPTNPSRLIDLNSRGAFEPKKRTFSQLLEHAAESSNRDVILPTLPLLPLTPAHPNRVEHRSHCSTTVTKSDEGDREALVGWPPVNCWRKKLRSDNYGDEVEAAGNYDRMVWVDHHHRHGSGGRGRGRGLTHVKVKMEGVGIARKIDLTMYHSFHTLKDTLMDMFGKCHQQLNSYELAYQDKEGDWLLAEDVSWRSFVQCAQRLKLLKSRG